MNRRRRRQQCDNGSASTGLHNALGALERSRERLSLFAQLIVDASVAGSNLQPTQLLTLGSVIAEVGDTLETSLDELRTALPAL